LLADRVPGAYRGLGQWCRHDQLCWRVLGAADANLPPALAPCPVRRAWHDRGARAGPLLFQPYQRGPPSQKISADPARPVARPQEVRAHGPAGPCGIGGTSLTPQPCSMKTILVLPGQANSAVISGLGRSRPGRRRHRQGCQIRTGVRWFSLRRLLYFGALQGPGPLGSGVRIMLLSWVELWGFEPQTSCMPYNGTTSTAVHLCRSPYRYVRISPPESRPVAVLSCCTPFSAWPVRAPFRRWRRAASPVLLVKGSGLGECPGGPAAPQENGFREAAG
jgi:hypothetical protein